MLSTVSVKNEDADVSDIWIPQTVTPKARTRTKKGIIKKEQSPSDDETSFLTSVKREPNASVKLKVSAEETKIKKMQFDDELTNRRYQAAGISTRPFPITADQATLDEKVSRRFMSSVYGGSSQDVFPTIGPEKLAVYHLNDWMYLPLDYHPMAPRRPGEPGFYFSVDSGARQLQDGHVKRVFTRVTKSPRALWLYQGQYEVRLSEPITKEEWQRQSLIVRNTWISQIQSQNWGSVLRARIYARKMLNREPQPADIEEVLADGHDKSVTKEEVALALTRGDETLVVYTLKCVGYEENFKQQLIHKLQNWDPRQQAGKKTSKAAGKRPAGEGASPKNAKRQRMAPHSNSSQTSAASTRTANTYVDHDDEEEEIDQPVYTPRGTRSRPKRT